MHSPGMNSTPAMAPLSPGLGGSTPLSSLSPKKTSFQSLGSLTPGMFSSSLAKGSSSQGKHALTPVRSPSPSIMTSPKLWQKASISRLAEEFFWIGGSVVAQPKWRLGQIGKIRTSQKSVKTFKPQSNANSNFRFLVLFKSMWYFKIKMWAFSGVFHSMSL